MDIYASWDGDHIGRVVGRSRLTDDVEAVRQTSQKIDLGNEIWKSFALRCGGSVVEMGGDEGCIEIDASHAAEIPVITEQYAGAVGATVSVGIGLKLSESSKALMVAKLRGGNQIVLWDPDMQSTIDATEEKSESDKIAEEYLNKADRSGVAAHTSHNVGKIRGAHAGFMAVHKPGAKVADVEPDAAAAKAVGHDAKAEMPEAPVALSDSAKPDPDFESQLHGHASDQEQKDGNDEVADDADSETLKQKIVQVLSQVKDQLPVLAQLQQTSPDAYNSIMGLVQGVILMGRKMNGPEEQNRPIDGEEPANVQKSEDLTKAISQIPLGQSIKPPAGVQTAHDYSHVLPEQHKSSGMKMTVEHNGPMLNTYLYAKGKSTPIGHADGFINHKRDMTPKSIEPHTELDPEYRGQGLGIAMHEALLAHAKHKLGINRVEGTSHSADASALITRLAQKHGLGYKPRLRPADARAVDKFPYDKFSYTIKNEPSANVDENDLIGPGKGLHFMCDCEHHDLTKDEMLEKRGLGSSGGSQAGRTHENLPVGTIKDNKVKIKHGDGGVGWMPASSGMIQAQDAGGGPVGQVSHPVNSKTPNES